VVAILLQSSGERVSNAWATCLYVWDSPGKLGIIPNVVVHRLMDNPKPGTARPGA
jgi:hypothetical protein